MSSYSKRNNQKNRSGGLINKDEITAGLRKSVISVLTNTDNYNHLVGDSVLVSDIADAVFASIYKKNGRLFSVRKGGTFNNMIESIMFNTEKVRQVHETKKQIMKATEAIGSDDAVSISFDVISASVTDKLDSQVSKELDFFESKFKNEVDKLVYAGSNMSLKNLPPRKDLLYLSLILVAEGTNANKDTIPAEELAERFLTLIGMPLVEEHEPQSIRGVFFDSKLVRIKPGKEKGSVKIVTKGGRLAVQAQAYVYKNRFPREAFMLKNRQEQGLLRYSVELAFSRAECGVCAKQFKASEQYCEHLLLRHSVNDDRFSRIVRDIYFIGGAYTINPAEKMAVSLEVTDPTDKKTSKSNKTGASCVNTIDDTGKVADENLTSHENTDKNNADGDKKSSNSDGGQQMLYSYNSVEELLESPEVNALVEAQVSSVLTEEREGFEDSLSELEDNQKGYKTKIEELEATLAEQKAELDAAKEVLSAMEADKKISDAILDLQAAGYSFDSEDEITAFSDQIKNMSEDQAAFIIDMMKKTVTATEEPAATEDVKPETDPDEGSTQASEESDEESKDETIEASQSADVNTSADGNQTLLSIRKDWDKRVETLTDKS